MENVYHSSVAVGHNIECRTNFVWLALAHYDRVAYSCSRRCLLLTSLKDKSDSNAALEQAGHAGHDSLQIQYKVVSTRVAI